MTKIEEKKDLVRVTVVKPIEGKVVIFKNETDTTQWATVPGSGGKAEVPVPPGGFVKFPAA